MSEEGLVVQTVGGVVVVQFRQAALLEAPAIEALGAQLYELVDAQAQRRLLLDFSRVTNLSSSMLGVLVKLRKKSATIGGRLAIVNLRPELRKVFTILRLEGLFEFHDSDASAMSSLGAFRDA